MPGIRLDTLLIGTGPGETRMAGLAEGVAWDFAILRAGNTLTVGQIWLGRVAKMMKGLPGAFVDLGGGRSGFLPADRQIGKISEGEAVPVQITREPLGDKPARLSMRLALAGNRLVYHPLDDSFALRERNSDAGDAESDRHEQAFLRARWQTADKAARAPVLLLDEIDPLLALLRDAPGGLERIVIDAPLAQAAAKRFCEVLRPGLVACLEPWREAADLFDATGMSEELERALARRVALPGGGSLAIDAGEALTAIDVNSGTGDGASAEAVQAATNMEAAVEIARQIRLRNLSGILVADFIHTRRRERKQAAVERLSELVASDPVPTRMHGITRLGLVEMTRERRRPALAEIIEAPCPGCAGSARLASPDSTALAALRRVLRESRACPGGRLRLILHPDAATALNGAQRPALAEAEGRLGRALAIAADASLARDAIQVEPEA